MEYQTRIATQDEDRRVFVDKYDDEQDGVWLSIQLNGGGANCVLTREQALEMVKAINQILHTED
ncbi:hypothetical protein UFOVP239_20 [uncultured Caudovirales phage]|uniref:Uncharacterized protein n=1 Tax=uncultured Caudovirales phage TaxID=2100421 RepID=A0A6J7WV41_9CAUD|nr:hypothetical protein UFOVP239_20 [uncultured Caudovirales phage]